MQAVKGGSGSWRGLWTGLMISPLSTRTLCRLRGYRCVLAVVHTSVVYVGVVHTNVVYVAVVHTNVVQATWLPLCISGCAHDRCVGYVATVV